MHDIKWIRENPTKFDEALKKRNIEPLSSTVLSLDEEKRKAITDLQNLQEIRNKMAKEISMFADKKSPEFQKLLKEAEELKQQFIQAEALTNGEDKLTYLLERLPNMPADDVPVGKDEEANVEVKKWGTPGTYDFTPLEHFDLGEKLGMMDFEQTAKISGSRFVSLKGDLARLERALMNFMLDIHTKEFGYEEATVPHLVRDNAMYGVGQLPKFEEDSFATTNGYRLIPTSEVSLTNFVADKVLEESTLPLRYTSFSYCFRSEAGSAGRDTRGMIRLHQFSKVELVSITKPEDSEKEHERMLSAAEEVLRRLELPYRVMLLSSGDMGFSATKTYDLEVWLPGQNKYREISSCSNCTDFQARRMKARYKNSAGENTLVHTLNGSGLAVGRTIVAILENYQNKDGSITVPHALIPYFGKEKIC